ncbi:response regulator [Virgibacillus flavescens]|uniref:response regulator n=1 Tax=Virgibacillus flavescens TaxID=1611422 RepID=UPI003D330E1A
MINVLLVEDQRLFSEGIKALINQEDDLHVIGMAENIKEAEEIIDSKQPDIVLMSIHIPEIDGVKATFQLKESYPKIKVILLTATMEEELIVTGLNAGADGFLYKNLNATKLVNALRDVYHGEMVISGEAARILASRIQEFKYNKKQILGRKLDNLSLYLSERELDISYLMMEGKSNKIIAQRLYLGEGTVKNYVSEIYSKIKIRSRTNAIEFFKKLAEKTTDD